jgi:hypothetical protein
MAATGVLEAVEVVTPGQELETGEMEQQAKEKMVAMVQTPVVVREPPVGAVEAVEQAQTVRAHPVTAVLAFLLPLLVLLWAVRVAGVALVLPL